MTGETTRVNFILTFFVNPTTTMRIIVLIAALYLSAVHSQQTLSYYQTGVAQGYASWYDSWAPGGGCGYNENIYAGYQPSVVLTAAINQGQYYNGEMCGMCIQVNNVTAIGSYNNLKPFPDPPFYAFINNLCTTCIDNQLDFYRTPQVQNNWYLDWQAVDCPVGNQKIRYQIEKEVHNYYFKFLPLYNLRTITSASVYQNNGWSSCERQNGYFACQAVGGPFGANPQIKLSSVDGASVTDNIQITLTSTPTSSIQVVDGQQSVNFAPMFTGAPSPSPSNTPPSQTPTSNTNTPSKIPNTSSPPIISPSNNSPPVNTTPFGSGVPSTAPEVITSPSNSNPNSPAGSSAPQSQSTPSRSNVPSTIISSTGDTIGSNAANLWLSLAITLYISLMY